MQGSKTVFQIGVAAMAGSMIGVFVGLSLDVAGWAHALIILAAGAVSAGLLFRPYEVWGALTETYQGGRRAIKGMRESQLFLDLGHLKWRPVGDWLRNNHYVIIWSLFAVACLIVGCSTLHLVDAFIEAVNFTPDISASGGVGWLVVIYLVGTIVTIVVCGFAWLSMGDAIKDESGPTFSLSILVARFLHFRPVAPVAQENDNPFPWKKPLTARGVNLLVPALILLGSALVPFIAMTCLVLTLLFVVIDMLLSLVFILATTARIAAMVGGAFGAGSGYMLFDVQLFGFAFFGVLVGACLGAGVGMLSYLARSAMVRVLAPSPA